ncbi:MAG TPA: hypothetical protein DIT59_15655 [Leclercia sp.]|nr:hypothetical protein [Leclercia sp.]
MLRHQPLSPRRCSCHCWF